jgi:probable HAF family extracellular repeat protein
MQYRQVLFIGIYSDFIAIFTTSPKLGSMMIFTNFFRSAICLLCLCVAAPASAQTYRLSDLGALGGETSYATSINNWGQVVGASYENGSANHATLWSNGAIIDLNAISGGSNSGAISINNKGQIVGVSDNKATLWTNGSATSLVAIDGGAQSSASAINAQGQVVGESRGQNGNAHATFWGSNGIATDLGALSGGSSYAIGINSQGQIAGTSIVMEGAYQRSHATLWSNGTMTQLEGIGGGASYASGINDLGQVVGYSESGWGPVHATLWTNGIARDLGTLDGNSIGMGINSVGQVVGSAFSSTGGIPRAFLWSNGVLRDLNEFIVSGQGNFSSLISARAINDLGQIVGQGETSDGSYHAFLLTPVPEPETYTMLIAGLGMVGFLIRRRRKAV